MEVVVSDYVIGEVLFIKCEDRKWKWKSIAYISKQLNKTERDYEIYEKDNENQKIFYLHSQYFKPNYETYNMFLFLSK